MLVGLRGQPIRRAIPPAAPSLTVDMTGRWIFAAPNAPSCGMNFAGAPGAHEGTVTPEGGCPGKFFTSDHWMLDQNTLMINDHENQPLAHLTFADGVSKVKPPPACR